MSGRHRGRVAAAPAQVPRSASRQHVVEPRRRPVLLACSAAALVAGLSITGLTLAGVGHAEQSPPAAAGSPGAHTAAAGVPASAASARTSAAVSASPVSASTVSASTDSADPAGDPGPANAVAPAPAAASTTPVPVRLIVAAIGVDTPLESLGIIADGSLQSPTQFPVAGWYSGGVRPGDVGPAVIAGHVDSRKGPAVFYKLRQLRAGDQIQVIRADGVTVTFSVDVSQSFPKNNFPTAAVYGPTPDAELRLITCTGDFNRAARSYLDNLVVTAHQI